VDGTYGGLRGSRIPWNVTGPGYDARKRNQQFLVSGQRGKVEKWGRTETTRAEDNSTSRLGRREADRYESWGKGGKGEHRVKKSKSIKSPAGL